MKGEEIGECCVSVCGGRKRMAQTVCEMARHPQVIEVAGSVRVLRVCRLSV